MGLVHLVTTVGKGLMHLDTTCHVIVGCVCNVASGGGEKGSPSPKPLAYPFRSDEDIGGGGIAPQALLLTSWVCTSQCFIVPYSVFQFISIEDVQLSVAAVSLWISHSQPFWSCFT